MPKPMSAQQKHAMMTETPIPRLIVRMAVPSVISMLVTSFYNIADTFFVGQIDTQSTAAVGVVLTIISIFAYYKSIE